LQFEVDINGQLRRVVVRRADGRFRVDVAGRSFLVDAVRVGPSTLSLLLHPGGSDNRGGTSHEVTVTPGASGQVDVHVGGSAISVGLNGRKRWRRRDEAGHGGDGPERIMAPMPGKVVRVLAKTGDTVQARQALVVMEAMKMENEIRTRRDGRVTELHVREGQSIDAGTLVAVVSDAQS
jgi:biotin carboxyl carrier protein